MRENILTPQPKARNAADHLERRGKGLERIS
jgi:hypothetical protein